MKRFENRKLLLLALSALFFVETDGQSRLIDTSAVWTGWSDWTACSMTCGRGVRTRHRECVGVNGGQLYRVATPTCAGPSREHETCQEAECPGEVQDHRTHQCQLRRRDTVYGQRYEWLPHSGVTKPCQLSCMAKGYRFVYNFGKMLDGSFCGTPPSDESQSVCVDGVCMTLGCDGKIGSKAVINKCMVCGGKEDECVRYKDSFTVKYPENDNYGYTIVAKIPKGATYIRIEDRSKNYLALATNNGSYVLNGNWQIDWPGKYQAEGTALVYARSPDGFNETITAMGPTSADMRIELIFRDENPGVTWEYYIPYDTLEASYRFDGANVDDLPLKVKLQSVIDSEEEVDDDERSRQQQQQQSHEEQQADEDASESRNSRARQQQQQQAARNSRRPPPATESRGQGRVQQQQQQQRKTPVPAGRQQGQGQGQGTSNINNNRGSRPSTSNPQQRQQQRQPAVRPTANGNNRGNNNQQGNQGNGNRGNNRQDGHNQHHDAQEENAEAAVDRETDIDEDEETRLQPADEQGSHEAAASHQGGRGGGGGGEEHHHHDLHAIHAQHDHPVRGAGAGTHSGRPAGPHHLPRVTPLHDSYDPDSVVVGDFHLDKCPPCRHSRIITRRQYCSSDFVVIGRVADLLITANETRYDIHMDQTYRSRFPMMQREFVWVPNRCGCPGMHFLDEYVLMGQTGPDPAQRRQTRLLLDRSSFVRPLDDSLLDKLEEYSATPCPSSTNPTPSPRRRYYRR